MAALIALARSSATSHLTAPHMGSIRPSQLPGLHGPTILVASYSSDNAPPMHHDQAAALCATLNRAPRR